jgi:Zn-dependent protease/predicted transcriptional regulator
MSLKIGRVIGVEIRIHYTWLIIFMLVSFSLAEGFMPEIYPNESSLVYWVTGVTASILLFVSVLIHELFHSYVAIRRGIAVPRITLFLFGGVSQIEEEPKDPTAEFRISVVGPLSSFALGGLFGILWFSSETLHLPVIIIAPVYYGFIINILLGLFNLLPAFPLDGGRILRARLWSRKKDVIAATQLATKISSFFAYGLMLLGFIYIISGSIFNGLWFIFIGWFLRNGAEATLQQTTVNQTLTDLKVKDIMTSAVITIDPNIPVIDAIRDYFYRYKHGGYPVVSDDELKGIITSHDVQNLPKEQWGSTYVWDIMTPAERLVTISPDEPATEALSKISKHDFGRILVVENNKLVGLVTRSDVMRAIRRRLDLKVEQA